MILAASACDTYRCIERYARKQDPESRLAFLCLLEQAERELTWNTVMHASSPEAAESLLSLIAGKLPRQNKAKSLQEMTGAEKKEFYLAALKQVGEQIDPALFSGNSMN